jgi:predicted nucleic acid-binding protein
VEMIAIDTNVLVRFLTRDDEDQFQLAFALFERETIHVPDTVFLETEWVLRYAYGYKPDAVLNAFRSLLGLPQVRATDATRLLQALTWHEKGLDFADALHLATSQETEALATFDRAFARQSTGLGQCRVMDLASERPPR